MHHLVLASLLALAPLSAPRKQAGGVAAPSADMSTPRASIAYQQGLIRAGNVDALRVCFTPRLQDRITPEVVARGRAESGQYSLDDLVFRVEMQGGDRARITMRNGRTLTTMVRTDGRWLADTIWFR